MSDQPLASAAPAADFYSPRELLYITPAGRRLSDYEAVICHVQPDFSQYDIGDWFLRSPTGHGVFEQTSTRLRHPNWFEYRDPGAVWQRPYTRQQAEEERAIDRAVSVARDIGIFTEIHPDWHRVLATVYEGWACAELGIFLALSRSVRPALSDTISMALVFAAVDRLRHQQGIALLALDLEAELAGYPARIGVQTWVEYPAYQPVRELVERLMVTQDWAETAFVVNYLFDPLITSCVTDRFLRRFAPSHGDIVTPHLLLSAERARRRHHLALTAFVEMVLTDSDRRGNRVPSEDNRRVLQQWVDSWAPDILNAVTLLAPIFDVPTVPPGAAKLAAAHVVSECGKQLLRYGLELPSDKH